MKTVGLLMLALVGSTYGAGMPGSCTDEKSCGLGKSTGPTPFACVSVQTSRTRVTLLKQCVPRTNNQPVCSGISPGLCPSFALWPSAYKSISSVCSLAPPLPPIKCGAPTTAVTSTDASSSGSSTTSTKNLIQCVDVDVPAQKTKTGAAYQCVDFDGTRLMFNKGNAADKFAIAMNYTNVVLDNCASKGGDVLCTGHGTCAPTSAGQSNYRCLCNMGYEGTYCENIVSGACANSAQCDAGECDASTYTCKCVPGTMGKKCEQCDPTAEADVVCGGHGKCTTTKGGARLLMALASNSTSSNSTSSTSVSSSNSTSMSPGTVKASNSSSSTTTTTSVAGNFCVCETGFSGTQCERKTSDGLKNKSATVVDDVPVDSASGMASLSTVASIALVVVAAAMF